ncbi:MAG: Uncharacterised protein [Flavobacteriia bacterium]|nr:MAG: Uncharacterised protein [Flavobacteriia bacterium]
MQAIAYAHHIQIAITNRHGRRHVPAHGPLYFGAIACFKEGKRRWSRRELYQLTIQRHVQSGTGVCMIRHNAQIERRSCRQREAIMSVHIRGPTAAVGEQRRCRRIGNDELQIASGASDAHPVPEFLNQDRGNKITHRIGGPGDRPRYGVQAEWIGRITRRRCESCAVGRRASQRGIRTPVQGITIHIKGQWIVLPRHIDREKNGSWYEKERC